MLKSTNWPWPRVVREYMKLLGWANRGQPCSQCCSRLPGKDGECPDRVRVSYTPLWSQHVSSVYTCDCGLCTHWHFREACGFLFSLHFSSGPPATFWSSWLCTLYDWTPLCQTSLRKLTFVYFERKKEKSESQLLPPALLIKRMVSQQERCCF